MKVIILSNIADLIVAYILRQLAAKQDGKVELRRTDIADEISCAPSQISYVLSTRFTPAKGFVVESRRGLLEARAHAGKRAAQRARGRALLAHRALELGE